MGKILKWLQISDIHFGEAGYDSQEVRDSFFENYSKEKFDLLFITGDMAYQANYKDAAAKIKSLMCEIGCDESRTFIVPGNHDFRRSQDRTDSIRKITNIDNLTDGMKDVFALGAQPYQAFCEDVLGHVYAKQCMEPCVVRHINGLPIDIILWNTSMMSCDGNDEHHLKLCCSSFQKEMGQITQSNLQIILGHHGLSFFDGSDYDKLKTQIKKYAKTKLYLCGHSHSLGVETKESITQVTCGSMERMNGDSRGYECGCIEGEIDTDVMTISGCLMTYANKSWQPSKDGVQENRVFSVTHPQFVDGKPPAGGKTGGNGLGDGRFVEEYNSIFGDKDNIGLRQMRYLLATYMTNDFNAGPKRRLVQAEQPLWRSYFVERKENMAVLLADKIYLIYLHDSKYPFLQQWPQKMVIGQLDQTDAACWWQLLEDIVGKACVPKNMIFDPYDLYADFMQPINDNLQQIQAATAGFLVHPEYITDDESIYGQLISVESLIRRNELLFALRDEELATVNKYRIENKQRYLMWTGNEGYGKTMFASHLLAENSISPTDDRNQGKATQAAPWLPQCLCVFCKYVQSADQAVALLMAQINACLVYPVHYEPSDNTHAAVMAGLTKYVQENGHVLLVVDALDELAAGKGFLRLLPPILPEGVTCILTSRDESAVKIAISELTNVLSFKMPVFKKKEVGLLLGVDKDPSMMAFANDVARKTNGIPILVQDVVSQYKQNLAAGITDTGKLDIQNTIVAYFSKLRKRWESSSISRQMLKLLVLATGTNIEIQINMDVMLSWVRMATNDPSVDSADIRSKMDELSDQIDQVEPECYMLKYKALSDVMTRSGGYPNVEWNEILQRVYQCYISGVFSVTKAIGLYTAGRLSQYSQADWEAIGQLFLEEIVKRDDQLGLKMMCQMPVILSVACYQPENDENSAKKEIEVKIDKKIGFPPFVCRALELGMIRKTEGSCQFYYLKNVVDVEEDITNAIQAIGQAASMGWLEAIQVLYRHYRHKKYANDDMALQYYEDAIELGDNEARLELAVVLADPEGRWKDSKRAASVLSGGELNDKNETLLGIIYLDYWEDDAMKENGVRHLQHAWDNGNEDAGYFLSRAQIETSDECVQQKGIMRIEELAKKEHVNSLVVVASYEIQGEHGFHNRSKGKKHLKRAYEISQDADIAFKCAQILRNSQEIGDMEEAYGYLRNAAEKLPEAKYGLAQAILNHKTTGTDAEAVQMLREASEAGYDTATIWLAQHALWGQYGILRDYEKSKETLALYAREKNLLALNILTDAYQEGDCLISRDELIQWLKEADQEGAADAPRYLYFILECELSYDEGQALLSRGLERGDQVAEVIFTMNRMENSEFSDEEVQGSLEILKRISQNGEEVASWALYRVYRGNVKGLADSKLADEYLALAAEQGYPEAMYIYGHQLLSSSGSSNKKRGKQYIDNVVQQDRDGGIVRRGEMAYEEQNFVQAASLFYDAYLMGIVRAMNNLAYMLDSVVNRYVV